MRNDKLLQAIAENKVDEAVEIIDIIGQKKDLEAVPILINLLETTENSNLRNSVALALSDIGANDAAKPIIAMLQHHRTQGNRGTLLYALKTLDYSPYIDELMILFFEGNYEVRRESFSLIKEAWDNISESKKLQYINSLAGKIEELEDSRDFLSYAYNILNE